jgi:hypothetical protein
MTALRLQDLAPKLRAQMIAAGAVVDPAKPKRQKFGNRFTKVDGINFHSAKEARRYSHLKMLERSGKITDLRLQPTFPLVVTDKRTGQPVQVGKYLADFSYIVVDPRSAPVVGRVAGERVVEDVKSEITEEEKLFVLKRALVEALHGFTLVIV